MKPERAVIVERLVLLGGFLAMVAAVAAFDWRIGLGLAGILASASALDFRRRP